MEKKTAFYRQLLALMLPMAAQNLLSALVNASDALMLGLLDQASLSAVSLAAQVQFVFSLFLDAMMIGATVLAAQYWGKGDARAVEKIQANTLRLSGLLGAGELEETKRAGSRLTRLSVLAGAVSGALLSCAPLAMRFAGRLTDTAQGYLRFMLGCAPTT